MTLVERLESLIIYAESVGEMDGASLLSAIAGAIYGGDQEKLSGFMCDYVKKVMMHRDGRAVKESIPDCSRVLAHKIEHLIDIATTDQQHYIASMLCFVAASLLAGTSGELSISVRGYVETVLLPNIMKKIDDPKILDNGDIIKKEIILN